MLAQADAFRIPLENRSVHCVVTSCPYWGLRKYQGDQGDEPLGLEPAPERHIERTVQWAREIWRVLRDDGVFWLNYGDCYAGGGRGPTTPGTKQTTSVGSLDEVSSYKGIGAGNLMLMPHRIALVLQADGWIVRQDLVWAKPNPMPESVAGWRWERRRTKKASLRQSDGRRVKTGGAAIRDIGSKSWNEYEYSDESELRRGSWRHTRAHEFVFMLVKSMGYWSDQEAVREPASENTHSRGIKRDPPIDHAGQGHADWVAYMDRDAEIAKSGRNPRSVLHIPTAPYRGAHYATFPPALIAPLILATCPRWCCPVCGQGWAPVVDKAFTGTWHDDSENLTQGARQDSGDPSAEYERPTLLGHRPTCGHPHTQAEAVPGIVLDPFVGSGTTVAVARQLLRRGIGLDISRPYLQDQARVRLGEGGSARDLPLFTSTPTAG